MLGGVKILKFLYLFMRITDVVFPHQLFQANRECILHELALVAEGMNPI